MKQTNKKIFVLQPGDVVIRRAENGWIVFEDAGGNMAQRVYSEGIGNRWREIETHAEKFSPKTRNDLQSAEALLIALEEAFPWYFVSEHNAGISHDICISHEQADGSEPNSTQDSKGINDLF